ncbi:hypothetical protein ASG90_14065 [Nocardioides sp. Soil797]|nr:hypothetical protein ASG90_14065 [Nocardioides sp. Soil797]
MKRPLGVTLAAALSGVLSVALLAVPAASAADGTGADASLGSRAATDAVRPSVAECAPWTKTKVASGFGVLENLAFDGHGGLLVSDQGAAVTPGAIKRLTPDGRRSVLLAGVEGPGGLVVEGRSLWFNAGNSVLDGLLGRRTGTVSTLDLDSGAVTQLAGGLAMPNGLARLSDGSLVVSNDVVPGTMTRIAPDGTRETYAASIKSTNGMAYDREAELLYVASTFTLRTTISVVDVRHPEATPRVITLDGLGPLNSADDLTLGEDGRLYVPFNVAGKVVQVDPEDGSACTIATGVPLVSSVRFGAGPGWDGNALYATSFLGSVTKLTPPAAAR